LDAQHFLTNLNDFMGGTLSTEEAAQRAEWFFTGLEGEGSTSSIVHKAKGIYNLSTRNPLLSLGNVQITESYRHVAELGQGAQDQAFKQFVSSKAGAAYKDVAGFADVKNIQNKTLKRNFWSTFVKSISDWSGEGGGRIYTPRRLEDINYISGDKTKTVSVDFGISGAAIGDWDGDQWYSMIANTEMGNTIGSTMKLKKLREGFMDADQQYKIRSEIYAQEAKAGLEGVAARYAAPEGAAKVGEDLIKEVESKAAVGSLDVRLNKARIALLDFALDSDGAKTQVEDALAMLKVIQEHAVIKGKHLPVARPFAAMLASGIESAFETGDISQFKTVLEEEIFGKGSALWGEGIEVGGVNKTSGYLSTPEFVDRSSRIGRMQLDNTLAFLQETIQRAIITGVADTPSIGQLTAAFDSGDEERINRAFNALHGGRTQQGSVIMDDAAKQASAQISHLLGSVRSASGRLDRRTASLMAVAGAGALAVGAAIGAPGYSVDLLIANGEVVPQQTRDAITAGNALQARGDHHIPPSSMGPGHNGFAMANTPINSGGMYASSSNAYQVRGEIGSQSGVNGFSGMMNRMGMRGSVRINDTRGPITSNYLDRLLGEY
jgi:hypothetical protein